jgi:hypothetical protein
MTNEHTKYFGGNWFELMTLTLVIHRATNSNQFPGDNNICKQIFSTNETEQIRQIKKMDPQQL